MPPIVITTRARADLLDIWLYIAKENRPAADRLLARFEEILDTLAQFPMIGRSRKELAPDLRSFPVGNHIIYYRPSNDGIEVIRVLNSSRDLGFMF